VTPGRPQIVVVAGLGRCGTSLALQMLAAGGVTCVGGAPSFEDAEHNALLKSDPDAWVAGAAGRAVKVLDPHRHQIPLGPEYRLFWLLRDWSEQARSQLKTAGAPQDRARRKRMERSLKAETDLAGAALARAGANDWELLPFDLLLSRPRQMAETMARHLGRDLDVDRMASVVVSRGPKCLDGFLELSLVAA